MGTYRQDAFSDKENLQKALQSLNDFYESITEDPDSSYALLLLSLAHRMVLQGEKDLKWFEGDEKRISDLLERTAEKCYKLDRSNGRYENNMDEIRVLVYKFRQYCGMLS